METCRNDEMNTLILSVVKDLSNQLEVKSNQPVCLPDKNGVIEIMDLFMGVLFPGFYGKLHVNIAPIEHMISLLLFMAADRLQIQIELAFLHEKTQAETSPRPSQIVKDFIEQLPSLREVLETDVEATLDGDPAAQSKDEIIFAYPGIYAISIYRMAHALHLLGVPLIPRIMTEHAHSLTGIDIHPGAEIGHHFFIDHGTGIVIGETTQIGNYVKIYQGVTLGALSTRGGQRLRGKKRHPTIEDEVTIYSSASILGGETVIGKGAVIGSNTFITQSVPAGTKVSFKAPELSFN